MTVASGVCATVEQACYALCDVEFKFTLATSRSADDLQDDIAEFLLVGSKLTVMRSSAGKFAVSIKLEMTLFDAANATVLATRRAELKEQFASISAPVVDDDMNTMTPITLGTSVLSSTLDDNSTLSIIDTS